MQRRLNELNGLLFGYGGLGDGGGLFGHHGDDSLGQLVVFRVGGCRWGGERSFRSGCTKAENDN